MPCRPGPALALAGFVALSGCGWIGSPGGWFASGSAPAASAAPSAATCPSATILNPLSQTAVFAPGAQHQPMGVAFYGILSDVTAKCDGAGDAVRAALDVVLIGERGPAGGRGEGIDLTYFVAVTGANQAILSKRSYGVHITIPPTAPRAGVTDHIEQTIPLAGHPAGEFGIVIGFQQPPDVIEFYRHFRGR